MQPLLTQQCLTECMAARHTTDNERAFLKQHSINQKNECLVGSVRVHMNTSTSAMDCALPRAYREPARDIQTWWTIGDSTPPYLHRGHQARHGGQALRPPHVVQH